MRKIFLIFLPFTSGSIIATIPVSVADKILVTKGVTVSGTSLSLIVDLNTADTILPVCENNKLECYDPRQSKTFLYCESDSQCFDRQYPPFTCASVSDLWDPQTAVFTKHTVTLGGSDIELNAFEFLEKNLLLGDLAINRAPLKGVINFSKGVLGIGPSRRSCRNETLLTQSGAKYFEFNSHSIKFYDSIPQTTFLTESYQLGDTNSSILVGKYAFNVFHPTLCGSALLGTVSSHWTAVVDASLECLIVPEFMFNSIKAWKAGSNGVIYFYLSENKIANSVALNLTNVCVEARPADITEKDISLTALRPIIFGSAALLAMKGIGFEVSGMDRVGFSQFCSPSMQCTTAVPTCIGSQRYDPALNECTNPDCSSFFLGSLNEEKGECEWSSFVAPTMYSVILALLVGEIISLKLKSRSTMLAQRACERNQVF